ncbi:hypothetical protein ACTXT7_001063 [Hymenolepis weldensis]
MNLASNYNKNMEAKTADKKKKTVARALTGHSASVQSLDFHPHGNFIASGSVDATVKGDIYGLSNTRSMDELWLLGSQLWDVSRKGCINTFRGHTGSVNMVRFSPDGNWIVSAGDDGRVKIAVFDDGIYSGQSVLVNVIL